MSFVALLDAAIAGTQRQTPPTLLARDEAGDQEPKLLRAAAYYGLRRLAGRPLERASVTTAIDPAPPEELSEVPHAAAVRLSELLEERTDLLPEWLRLVGVGRMRVPHALLPELLEHAQTEVELQPLILAVGGERMRWLAGLNPDWLFAARFDAEDRFATGRRDERILALRHIRERDPARARELLREVWSSERGDTLAALVALLADGLCVDDEPLLEQAQQAARKEVRSSALLLLRRLPESGFARRWTQRARAMLRFEHGELQIDVPVEAPAAWLADGIETGSPKGIGERAWLLQQALAFTPPAVWPLDLVEQTLHTDWARPLIAGLGQAAVSYADRDWCERLLLLWARSVEAGEQLPLNGQDLFAALDSAHAESAYRFISEPGIAASAALSGVRHDAWSIEFSQFMLRRIPEALARWRYTAVGLLRDAPLYMDPAVHAEAQHMLDGFDEPAWAWPALERVVQTLELRATMRQELLAGVAR